MAQVRDGAESLRLLMEGLGALVVELEAEGSFVCKVCVSF